MVTKHLSIVALALGLGGLAVPAASAETPASPAPPVQQAHPRVERVSVAPDGGETTGISQLDVDISATGRYVAFASVATDMVSGDTNRRADVFLRDLLTDSTTRASVGPGGQQLTADAIDPVMSSGGRFVAFTLIRWQAHVSRIYVYDQQAGTSRLVLRIPYTDPENLGFYPKATDISADGRFVVLETTTRLSSRDQSDASSVYVRDRSLRRTALVSQTTSGADMGDTGGGRISAGGRYIVFGNGSTVYLRDRLAHRTMRMPVSVTGHPDPHGWSGDGSISADGRYIAFTSSARNLVRGDTNDALDVFVRDRVAHTTALVSLGAQGQQGRDNSELGELSGHGRYVTFVSEARNLVAGDTNRTADVFVRDRLRGTTRLVFRSVDGGPADGVIWRAKVSANGQFVAAGTDATNLVSGDTNGNYDAFVRDLSR